jgi:hypothetical protein
MENRKIPTVPARSKGPVKVKSGDFEPPGGCPPPLIDDRPPSDQDGGSDPSRSTNGSQDHSLV